MLRCGARESHWKYALWWSGRSLPQRGSVFWRVLQEAAHRKVLCAIATECCRSHVPCRSQRTDAHGNHEEKPLLTKLTWWQLTKDQVFTGPHYTDADLEVKDCLGAEWQKLITGITAIFTPRSVSKRNVLNDFTKMTYRRMFVSTLF